MITEKNVRSVRPSFGLHPKFLPKALGKRAKKDVLKGDRFTLSQIK